MNGSQLLRAKYATVRVKTRDILTSKIFVSRGNWRWEWKWSNKYLAETDDVMTESASGRKLVNKLVKKKETVMEEEGAAVCQEWGSMLLGAGVHSPNSWCNFASEWGWLLQSSSSSSRGSLVPPGHFPNQCGGHTSVHVQRCHSCHHLALQPVCAQWVGSSWSRLCIPGHNLCRGPGTLQISSSPVVSSSSRGPKTASWCWLAGRQLWSQELCSVFYSVQEGRWLTDDYYQQYQWYTTASNLK